MKRLLFLLLVSGYWLLVMPQSALAATLSLSPASGTFNRGCGFTVDIVVDTEGAQTDGTDAIVLYDSSRLSGSSITSGTIYQDYPGNNIDDTAGKITVSGLASVAQAFSGKGVLASIGFTVKDNASTGITQVKFDFDPNNKAKTIDSNVVERGTVVDVLNSVVNGNYTIGTGACGIATTSTGTVTTGTGTGAGGGTFGGQGAVSTPSGGTVPIKTLPEGGTAELTFTLAIVGAVLTILGILGLVLL